MDEQDKRTVHHTTAMSPGEEAVIARAKGGMPWARWLREAALEKAGRDLGIPVTDTARRPAPRRGNHGKTGN